MVSSMMKRQRRASGIALCAAILVMVTPGWAAAPGAPLAYEFSRVQVPSTTPTTTPGTVGGLPATWSLTKTPQPGCATGSTCGTFSVSVKGLSPTASTQFGQIHGTFSCSSGACSFALTSTSGVFSKVTGATMAGSPTGASAGLLATGFANHGGWVSTVAGAAAKLKAEGMMPAGMTVGDLVSKAARAERKEGVQASQGSQGSSQGGHGTGSDPGKGNAGSDADQGNGAGNGSGGGGGQGGNGGQGDSGGRGEGSGRGKH